MDLSPVFASARVQYAADGEACRRLFHGRGGCYPGLEGISVDWFPPVAVVTLHRELAWVSRTGLVDGLRAIMGERLACLLVQERHRDGAPWQTVFGAIPQTAYAVEAGLRYRLRLGTARNLGFFPDMARGRALVHSLASNQKVLNLFAYTCSFSLAALAGGAAQVVNLDMNRGALELGRQNHLDNGFDLRRASFLAHDLFKSFGKLRRLGPFDLVVIDPPSHQGASFSARRHWPRLVRQLSSVLAPRADVVACLNSPHLGPEFLEAVFTEQLPPARLIGRAGAPPEFPDRDPDRGLKILHYRWEALGAWQE